MCVAGVSVIDKCLGREEEEEDNNKDRTKGRTKEYLRELGRVRSGGFQPIEKPPSGRMHKQTSRDSDNSDQLTGSDYYWGGEMLKCTGYCLRNSSHSNKSPLQAKCTEGWKSKVEISKCLSIYYLNTDCVCEWLCNCSFIDLGAGVESEVQLSPAHYCKPPPFISNMI